MDAMIEHLINHRLGAHILDGPTGPIGKVKAGAIKMAQETNAFVVPFYVHAEKAWYFNSWDQFMLPRPFSTVTLIFGKEMHLVSNGSSSDFEARRQVLESTMRPGLILKNP